MEVGVHPRLEYRDTAQALKLGGVRFVVECTGDQNVESAICRLARRLHEVRARHRAELRAYEDCGTALDAILLVTLHVETIGAYQPPWPEG